MPPDLKERVAAAAKSNNRSMNAEIVATLEEKYPEPQSAEEFLADLTRRIESIPPHMNALTPEGFLRAELIDIRDRLLEKMKDN